MKSEDTLGNTVFVWIIAGLGSIALAANNIDITLNFVATIPLIGLGIGCSVLCGKAIGENDYPQIVRLLFVTLALEMSYVAVVSAFEIFMPTLLLTPFGLADRPIEIQRASIATSQVLWIFSVAFGFSMTSSAVLESFGLTRFLFVARFVFMWLMSIPAVYFVASNHSGNADFLPGCWIIGGVCEGLVGIAYFWRLMTAIRKRQKGIVLHAAGQDAAEAGPLSLT